MPDNSDQQAVLYRLLGELSADVKHILTALNESKKEQERLRVEFREENNEIKLRLDKVEKFNVRVLTLFAVFTPIVIAFINWGVPTLLALL